MQRLILTSALVTTVLLGLVLYASCTKPVDECEKVTCKNGGTCSGGTCLCPAEYTGANCETRKCEANQTAKVRFLNKTGNSRTYSVVWDGSVITTLGPGAASDYYTVAAGEHTLHFMIPNSGNEACAETTPNLAVCSSMEYWCTN